MVSRGDPGLLFALGQSSCAEGALAQIASQQILDQDPELLNNASPEIKALFLSTRAALVGNLGDGHSGVSGENREENPKRVRGSPTSEDSPPAAPSPKRAFDGRGTMELDPEATLDQNPLGPAQHPSLGGGRSPLGDQQVSPLPPTEQGCGQQAVDSQARWVQVPPGFTGDFNDDANEHGDQAAEVDPNAQEEDPEPWDNDGWEENADFSGEMDISGPEVDQNGNLDLGSWAGHTANALNFLQGKIGQLEAKLGNTQGAVAQRFAQDQQNIGEMRNFLDALNHTMDRHQIEIIGLKQQMEVNALTAWLKNVLQADPEVRQQISGFLTGEMSGQFGAVRAGLTSFLENLSRDGFREVQQLFAVSTGQLGNKCSELATGLDGVRKELGEIQMKIGQGPMAPGAQIPQLSDLIKVQTDVKLLAQVLGEIQKVVANFGQILPTVGSLKSDVDALVFKARAEVAREISQGENENRQQNLKIWEKLAKSQDEKLEARMQSLEKVHKAEILQANRRIDSLNQENLALRQEIRTLGKTPMQPPQITVVQPQIPADPPQSACFVPNEIKLRFPEFIPELEKPGGGALCRILQEKLEREAEKAAAPKTAENPFGDLSESSGAFVMPTAIHPPEPILAHG
jgi:hypothetical protein